MAIFKSSVVWGLYCNHQVHRGFFITLYFTVFGFHICITILHKLFLYCRLEFSCLLFSKTRLFLLLRSVYFVGETRIYCDWSQGLLFLFLFVLPYRKQTRRVEAQEEELTVVLLLLCVTSFLLYKYATVRRVTLIAMAARLTCGSAAARLLGLWVWTPPEAWIYVSCECCVLSGRGRCFGLIPRPEEFYRLWCVWVWP
jgi:hypothetical protein